MQRGCGAGQLAQRLVYRARVRHGVVQPAWHRAAVCVDADDQRAHTRSAAERNLSRRLRRQSSHRVKPLAGAQLGSVVQKALRFHFGKTGLAQLSLVQEARVAQTLPLVISHQLCRVLS